MPDLKHINDLNINYCHVKDVLVTLSVYNPSKFIQNGKISNWKQVQSTHLKPINQVHYSDDLNNDNLIEGNETQIDLCIIVKLPSSSPQPP
jgi:hypothetical protein